MFALAGSSVGGSHVTLLRLPSPGDCLRQISVHHMSTKRVTTSNAVRSVLESPRSLTDGFILHLYRLLFIIFDLLWDIHFLWKLSVNLWFVSSYFSLFLSGSTLFYIACLGNSMHTLSQL